MGDLEENLKEQLKEGAVLLGKFQKSHDLHMANKGEPGRHKAETPMLNEWNERNLAILRTSGVPDGVIDDYQKKFSGPRTIGMIAEIGWTALS